MRYASKADAENIRSRPITETRPIKANRNKDNTGIKSTKNMISYFTEKSLPCDELLFQLVTPYQTVNQIVIWQCDE